MIKFSCKKCKSRITSGVKLEGTKLIATCRQCGTKQEVNTK